MRQIKITKIHWSGIISVLSLVILLVAYTNTLTFAVPPDTKYSPGEILDPDCYPGDTNCTVSISSQWITTGNDIYYNTGNVGIGTTSPVSKLDIEIGTVFSYTQTFHEYGVMGELPPLNDAEFSGTYTGSESNIIYVLITKEGETDSFSYHDENGDCPLVSDVPASTSPTEICDGISITFGSQTGHTVDNGWEYNISLVPDENPILDISSESKNYFSVNAVADGSTFLGVDSGIGANEAKNSNFIGTRAGYDAINAEFSNFFGYHAGDGASNASNSIFIGQYAGASDTADNTMNSDDFSILIGKSTSTGGFENSIALGGSAVNTASNQFMIGSATRPINTTRWNGSGSTQCTITTGTGIACTSDERLKKNITDLPDDTLDKLIKLKTVTYNWKDGNVGVTNVGFIAQDIEQYFPELVSTDAEGYKSVYYGNITPILVESIRELNLKIDNLDNYSSPTNTVSDFLSEIFSSVENGVLFLKNLVVETLKIGSSEKRTGITLYDEITGDPYCLSIAGGVEKVVSGECQIFTNENSQEDNNSSADGDNATEENAGENEEENTGDTSNIDEGTEETAVQAEGVEGDTTGAGETTTNEQITIDTGAGTDQIVIPETESTGLDDPNPIE